MALFEYFLRLWSRNLKKHEKYDEVTPQRLKMKPERVQERTKRVQKWPKRVPEHQKGPKRTKT